MFTAYWINLHSSRLIRSAYDELLVHSNENTHTDENVTCVSWNGIRLRLAIQWPTSRACMETLNSARFPDVTLLHQNKPYSLTYRKQLARQKYSLYATR